jgi:ABC-type sugar transport system ATPase subunit
LSVTENVIAASLGKVARRGFHSRCRSERVAQSAIAALGIKAPSPESPVRALSGGNQQKTLLARWLETDPEILIVDEPTRGVDVAAKRDIHAMLARLADAGAGIVVISSDVMELIALADRIVVMHAGRVAGELDAGVASEEATMSLASGLDGASSGRSA